MSNKNSVGVPNLKKILSSPPITVNGTVTSPKEILSSRSSKNRNDITIKASAPTVVVKNVTSPPVSPIPIEPKAQVTVSTSTTPTISAQNSPDVFELKNSSKKNSGAKRSKKKLPVTPGVALPSKIAVEDVDDDYVSPGKISHRKEVEVYSSKKRKNITGRLPASPPALAIPMDKHNIPEINIRPIGVHRKNASESRKVEEVKPVVTSVKKSEPKVFAQQKASNLEPAERKKPDYSKFSDEKKSKYMDQFAEKFRILKNAFPSWNIPEEIPEDWDISQTHDEYEKYVKKIVVSQNCGEWKTYLIVIFLAMEAFCIKICGLDMGGFTMAQLRMMNKYEELLVELGEKYYAGGISNWPIEVRILILAGFNCIVFLAVRYLVKWLGCDDNSGKQIQDFINNSLSGNSSVLSKSKTDEMGITEVPISSGNSEGGGNMGGIGDILGGLGSLFTGGNGKEGGGDITNFIATVGSNLTSNLSPGGGLKPGGSSPIAKPAADKTEINW